MTTTIDATTIRVRELNDRLRTTLAGGRLMFTDSVSFMDEDKQRDLLRAVRAFDAFTKGNDPHGEHDFGSVELAGEKYFWKIDYYAPDMEHGSENPADPSQTVRVMTIMHASEY